MRPHQRPKARRGGHPPPRVTVWKTTAWQKSTGCHSVECAGAKSHTGRRPQRVPPRRRAYGYSSTMPASTSDATVRLTDSSAWASSTS